MGRTSDYTKQVRNEEYENIVETTKKSAKSFADIKRMFAKEPMTAEQFGIYLGGCKAAGDFISDKTIKEFWNIWHMAMRKFTIEMSQKLKESKNF